MCHRIAEDGEARRARFASPHQALKDYPFIGEIGDMIDYGVIIHSEDLTIPVAKRFRVRSRPRISSIS